MPPFTDAHCHILPTGLDLQKLHLGDCQSREDILARVRARMETLDGGDWLLAVHYDQTKFADGRHVTRAELDQISATRPILLRHVNGHASIANSAALLAAHVPEDVPDPKGGEYLRDDSGSPNGVLLERAHEHVSSFAPRPTLDQMIEAILLAGEKMSALNIATASDMMTGRWDLAQELEAYRIASERGCKINVRLYAQWSAMFGPRKIEATRLATLTSAMDEARCRLAGIKIFADGAIGSATAAIYGRYMGGEQAHGDTSGQLIYPPERLTEMVLTAHRAGYQVAVHSIGDYSTDLVLNAFEATGEPSRHRIEHAMLLSDGQIDRMAKLNCFCTMQPEFLMRFGHAYKRQLGPERAKTLKRARSVIDAGIRLSFSSDRPIVAGDPLDGINTAVGRPEGFDLSENVTLEEAIDAYTRQGILVNGDA